MLNPHNGEMIELHNIHSHNMVLDYLFFNSYKVGRHSKFDTRLIIRI